MTQAVFANGIARARDHAPFLAGAMARRPDIAALLQDGALDAALDLARNGPRGPLRQRLRQQRDGIALAVAVGDLAGALSLEQVIGILSQFADEALDLAIVEALRERTPQCSPQGFVAIALGKHGSSELNYSSDIDPILLFDPATMPRRQRDDPGEAAVRVARTVVDLLQTRDADGYVFRVDLRLRPASEATPLAIPVNAAISHYESSALGWERAAFIRARAAAGDRDLGARFLSAIQPFIWRRSLDFGAIEELRAMSRRIREHVGRQAFGPGYDLKRGRGGIREVEFFVQIHQLIHGGRDPELRVADTLGGITALERAGRIDRGAAEILRAAYRVFRTIEHRLQMVEDRQTHALPTDRSELDNVARLHGLDDGAALLALLAPHVAAVGALYDGLDASPRVRIPQDKDNLVAALHAAGFPDAGAPAARIREWRSGKLRALRSASALEAFEAALPELLRSFGRASDPLAALNAFDRMLGGLPSAINLFRLLQARPALLAKLVEIISHAPTLAEALGRNPALLDRLLDATAADAVTDVPGLAREMRSATGDDVETRLDRVRRIVSEHRFALGTQIVTGQSDPLEVAGGYARVAEAAISVVADAVTANFVDAHGRVPDSELVILALGRLGGAALTHASDLDLIYLFTGAFGAESGGPKPLSATHYYNRLGQRLSSGLSAPTSAGALYEVDTRLRPSGNDGPLVVSVDSFARYQRESAWTWEHMALTRARVIYGGAAARETVQSLIAQVLCAARDPQMLARDVLRMRDDMAQHKPPSGPLDVKLCPGGLVDLEFAVHFHQLASGSGLSPHLSEAIAALAAAGHVSPALGEAHDLLTRMIVTLRLVAPSMAEPAVGTQGIVARACGASDWANLLVRIAAARHCVTEHWQAVIERANGQ